MGCPVLGIPDPLARYERRQALARLRSARVALDTARQRAEPADLDLELLFGVLREQAALERLEEEHEAQRKAAEAEVERVLGTVPPHGGLPLRLRRLRLLSDRAEAEGDLYLAAACLKRAAVEVGLLRPVEPSSS